MADFKLTPGIKYKVLPPDEKPYFMTDEQWDSFIDWCIAKNKDEENDENTDDTE